MKETNNSHQVFVGRTDEQIRDDEIVAMHDEISELIRQDEVIAVRTRTPITRASGTYQFKARLERVITGESTIEREFGRYGLLSVQNAFAMALRRSHAV